MRQSFFLLFETFALQEHEMYWHKNLHCLAFLSLFNLYLFCFFKFKIHCGCTVDLLRMFVYANVVMGFPPNVALVHRFFLQKVGLHLIVIFRDMRLCSQDVHRNLKNTCIHNLNDAVYVIKKNTGIYCIEINVKEAKISLCIQRLMQLNFLSVLALKIPHSTVL